MKINISVDKDINGTPVISSLNISFDGEIPEGGISSKTLKGIKLEDLLTEYFSNHQEQDFSEIKKQFIIQKATEHKGASGRKSFSNEYYAALSYLYIDTHKSNPNTATHTLANLLGIPKRTLVNRLATARKLNLLTQHSSGKAGGSLTSMGLKELRKI
jgi:hypothetical protein